MGEAAPSSNTMWVVRKGVPEVEDQVQKDAGVLDPQSDGVGWPHRGGQHPIRISERKGLLIPVARLDWVRIPIQMELEWRFPVLDRREEGRHLRGA